MEAYRASKPNTTKAVDDFEHADQACTLLRVLRKFPDAWYRPLPFELSAALELFQNARADMLVGDDGNRPLFRLRDAEGV
jgi:hypothetical protein